MSTKTKALKVKVGEVKLVGRHNTPWVITWPTNAEKKKNLGSITFAASEDVWDGKHPPEAGEFLVVSDIRQKPQGWRAHTARYFREDDIGDPDIVQ